MRIVALLTMLLLGAMPALAQAAPAGNKPAAAKPAAKPGAKPAPKPKAVAKPAVKPAAKPKPAPKIASTPQPVRDTYAAMPGAERMAIQSDLMWTGDYNGLVNGDFGDRSIAAVKAFQKRNKTKETGILNPQERDLLAAAAKAKSANVGWRMVEDKVMGARLGIPAKIAPQTGPGKTGTRWFSAQGQVQIETFRINVRGTTLAAVFEQQKEEPPGRKILYSALRSDFFVLSGLQGLKKFYVRAQAREDEVRGLMILYDQATEGIMEPVVIAMSNAFAPFGAVASAGTVPPPRRKVEYGTGIVVSPAGDILADRQVTDGCQVIVVAGFGHAERIAEDKDVDLALLRVYGARDLVPAPIAEDPSGGDIILAGVADPQAQAGGAVVSIARARVGGGGAARAVEPAPAQGYSGAAALDPQGRLLGVVQLTAAGAAAPPAPAPQASLVALDAVRKFLTANDITPASGRASVDDAKASVVRVICVRK